MCEFYRLNDNLVTVGILSINDPQIKPLIFVPDKKETCQIDFISTILTEKY